MSHIFISYASHQYPLTEAVAAQLEVASGPVWLDVELEAHGEYEVQIRQTIADAGAFVVIWSEGAAASKFVDIDRALGQGKLVSLRAPEFPIGDIPLDFRLDHCAVIDLSDLSAVVSTVETVWQGRASDGLTPFHVTHRERYVAPFDPTRRLSRGADWWQAVHRAELATAERFAQPVDAPLAGDPRERLAIHQAGIRPRALQMEAHAATEEAVAIGSRLASARPDALEHDLASSLGNLVDRLREADWFGEAEAEAAEGLSLLTRHFEQLPDARCETMDARAKTLETARQAGQ